MRTFIRVVEVWVPTPDHSMLVPDGGYYRAAPSFATATRDMCFGRDEGLPGQAWHQGRPLLLSSFACTGFVRTTAAHEAGLEGAIGLPVFDGDRLTSVAVLMFGEPGPHVGAVELWRNNPRVTGDMTLAAGYFGTSAGGLEGVTRDAWLPRGAGAPGLAWQRQRAVYLDELAAGSRFLRAQAAAQAGIVAALALPCGARDGHAWVVSLLSSRLTPIARRVESWLPHDDGGLYRAFGHCGQAGRLQVDPARSHGLETLGAIGASAQSRSAKVECVELSHAALPPDEVRSAGLNAVLVLPTIDEDRVVELVALYL